MTVVPGGAGGVDIMEVEVRLEMERADRMETGGAANGDGRMERRHEKELAR